MKINGNILVLTQWSYKDALVQTYTLPYVKIIREVIPAATTIILVTAEKSDITLSEPEQATINRDLARQNMQWVGQTYRRFGWRKLLMYPVHFFQLIRLIRKNNINVIHAFCMPAGGIGYMLAKFLRLKLVIDSYEPHATAMLETGAWKKNGWAYRILFYLEKKISRYASYVIATTEGMRTYAKENYGVELNHFSVKPACIDFTHFYPREKDPGLLHSLGLESKIVCIYAGKLGGTYLKDEVFDFIKACHAYWQDDFRFLMLTGETASSIQDQIKRVGLPANVVIAKFVAHQAVPVYMSLGDFAINPQVPVPSKRYGAPIKTGEYWGMGLPVVISPGISDDSDIIAAQEIGVVTDLQNRDNYPSAIMAIDGILKHEDRSQLQERIFKVAKQYRSFSIARKIYPLIYENR
ncbi:MAG: glycosyltransferase [Terrimonas sp.]|nr:glycosyltransferase [Terrimonas sp.]